jgi:2-polyprenyl-6-hydroxyphenyl methylase/3-demethylubiquinone-9 3-methyltransferase
MADTPSQSRTALQDTSAGFDTSSHDAFFQYYAAASASAATLAHFRRVRDALLGLAGAARTTAKLDVLDVGCGAGTFSRLWAELGHRVVGIDINAPLVELGRERARAAGQELDLRVGSATEIPLPDRSFDIVCAPELLEHIQDYGRCLDELTRVLRPGGLIYLSTTNRLCPRQQEFNLPLYSWYPPFLQRHFVRLAMTTRPELANHAKYPAFHWFTFYGLRRDLARRGIGRCVDRFDLLMARDGSGLKGRIAGAIRSLPGLRFLGQMVSGGTIIAGIKVAG